MREQIMRWTTWQLGFKVDRIPRFANLFPGPNKIVVRIQKQSEFKTTWYIQGCIQGMIMTPLVWNNPLGTNTLRPPLTRCWKRLFADRNGDVSMQTTILLRLRPCVRKGIKGVLCSYQLVKITHQVSQWVKV